MIDLADLPVVVKPMRLAHIPVILEIERESFALPWPERAYRYELTQNDLSHYYVLCLRSAPSPSGVMPLWQRLWQTLHRPPADVDFVLGHGGLWLMVDEAHISTLAVRAAWRRRGLGELLLVVLLDESQRLGASRATLEVRHSNAAAQALYAKYGFQQAGRRKAYYSDNREDALILTTPEFSALDYRDLICARRNDLWRRLAEASLDKITRMH